MNTHFSSIETILEYNFRYASEVNDALGSLEAMYNAGNISYSTYNNVKTLLEDKLRNL